MHRMTMRPHTSGPGARKAGAVVLLLAVLLALAGCGSSGTTTRTTKLPTSTSQGSGKPTHAAARAAQIRLDGALIDQWNAANDVSAKPYACMRKSPRGGPALAKCVATCQKCTISMATLKRRVAKAYNGSPSYVRRVYHATYLAQMRNFDDRRAVLRAFAEYSRVHGASYYQGMAEFDRAKALVKKEDASAAVWRKRFSRARKDFGDYLAKLD